MKVDKNSMLYWFPKIVDVGIPYPRTEIVEVDGVKHGSFVRYIDSPNDFPRDVLNKVKTTAKKIGYPVFMRTDLFSGKHNWERTCFVEKEEDVFGQIINLVEDSACAGILGLSINAFVLREFVELDSKFKAFHGMPVARERRYFLNNGMVLCHHPYWIEDAIRFWQKGYEPPENWKELLAEINTETKEEIALLTKMAFKIAYNIDGYWSVDFAKTKHDGWFLIDMAIGYDSWHPTCEQKLEGKPLLTRLGAEEE